MPNLQIRQRTPQTPATRKGESSESQFPQYGTPTIDRPAVGRPPGDGVWGRVSLAAAGVVVLEHC